MNEEQVDIVQLSKDFIQSQLDDLTGNDDPTPFQIVKSADGAMGIAMVHIPEDHAGRDVMADYLTAACCAHRAVETIFSSAVWSSVYENPADVQKELPGQRANRVELMILMHATQAGLETHTAALLRVDGAVRLSPWITGSEQGERLDGGRIPNALQRGLRLSREMPPELEEALGLAREILPLGRVVELFAEQLRGLRVRQESSWRN